MYLKLISISVLISIGHAFSEPCETNNFIDNWKRSTAYRAPYRNLICDVMLEESWYRITSKAGERMPTECVINGYKCGTAFPIYLSRKGVPSGEDIFPAAGQIVNRTAYEVKRQQCANAAYPIRIKNCTLYLVYYLRPTTGCDTAYCFGAELPCPAGQLSATGFSPGCGEVYPNISLTPTIEVDIHVKNVTTQDGPVIVESAKFLCSVIDATTKYAYDINFYINKVIIAGAKYINISYDNIRTATLLQEHWEGAFKPNMMVKCSIQARYKDKGVAGHEHFSDDYFAGIKVVDGENGIRLRENQTESVHVRSTMPIGCSYEIGKEEQKASCYLGLYNGVPKYQNTGSNQVKCSDGSFVLNNLEFAPQNCRLQIPHDEWDKIHYINITGVSDEIVNKADRIVFLRLYTALNTSGKTDDLRIWNSITLPNLKVYIVDQDRNLLSHSCYSHNDPHMRTFDQKPWKFISASDKGEYVMYKHERLPQQVNAYFSPCTPNKGLCNCAVAVRSASSIFIVNFCGTGPSTNRKINRYITARLCDDQNLIVKETVDNTFEITLPSGTTVIIVTEHNLKTDTLVSYSTISMIDIKPSNLDTNLTTGLCGRYNGNDEDDFITSGNIDFRYNTDEFARSWKITDEAESFFRTTGLPDLTYKVQEYCTCKADETIQDGGHQHEPNFECKLSDKMRTCRQIELPTTVLHASCLTSSHRPKRSLEEDDETPPMYDMMDDAQVKVDAEPAVWINDLTEEIARQKCENAFNMTPAYEACELYVPTVHADNYIEQCISDMKTTGSDMFLLSTIRNFETMCLSDAKKFENLTETNITSPKGESKSIFSVIAELTCPRNCSGKGSCSEGKCLCIGGTYGDDCSLDINKQPRLMKTAFADNCDTSIKSCRTFIVPGIDFILANLTCKFRSFYVLENSSYIAENESFTNPGTYSSSFLMFCKLPGWRKSRTIAEEYVASGYFISVSNNGNEFTEELTVIIFDARCYTCYSTTFECNEVNTCPTNAMYRKSDPSNYFGIGFGIALVAFIVLIMVIVFQKKRFFTRKYDVSNTSQQNPHAQYETVSSISLSNYHEYSSILTSSESFTRESSSLGLENTQYENLPE